MKTITVGFSTSRGFGLISSIIRRVLDTDFSHTYIDIDGLIYEADLKGVRRIDRLEWIKESKVILEVTIRVPDERFDEILKFLDNADGTPYGFWQLFRIWIGWNYKDNGEDAYICSELIARAMYEELGYCLTAKLDMINPKHIYNRVLKYASGGDVGNYKAHGYDNLESFYIA